MNQRTMKLIIAFGLGAFLLIGTFYVYKMIGLNKNIAPPDKGVLELPNQIGPWKGEDREMHDITLESTEATEVVNRAYSDPTGKQCSCHIAVFTNFWLDVPHSPLVCYPGSGWTREKMEDIELKAGDGTSFNAQLVTFQMDGRRVFVVFWYQMGDARFVETPGMETARQKYRSSKQWPSIIKVLLQTDATNAEQGRKRIAEFASLIYDWTSTMQKDPAETPVQPQK